VGLKVSKKNRVAVYGVCKNEESNILTWYESAKNADYIFLLDTGSTDNTVEIAKSLGINVLSASFLPWSETQAKNTALALLPNDIDICVCLDLDQVIVTENWKEILSDIELGFGIAEHQYTSNTGYIDSVVTTTSSWIHERGGISWVKYRPITFDYKRDLNERLTVPIVIKHLIGSLERFEHREPLYIEAFINELKTIELYSSRDHKLHTLKLIALSYFESEDYENFVRYYHDFINFYETADFQDKEREYTVLSFYLITLAMSVYRMADAGESLESLLDIVNDTNIRNDINLRLAIYHCVLNNKNKAKEFLNNVEDGFCDNVVSSINNILNNGINTIDALVLSEYYGAIGWGKSHQGMVNEFIKLKNVVHL
jgi:glycosyltransferase involved in cell wall biosynthesis